MLKYLVVDSHCVYNKVCVRGFLIGTNVIPISFKVLPMVPMVIGNANGTIYSPNGTIGANGKPMVPLVSHWLPMVPLVKLPMVPLGER